MTTGDGLKERVAAALSTAEEPPHPLRDATMADAVAVALDAARLPGRALTVAASLVCERSRADAGTGRRYERMRFDNHVEGAVDDALRVAGSYPPEPAMAKQPYFFRAETVFSAGT